MSSFLKTGQAALVLSALMLLPAHSAEKSTILKSTSRTAQIKAPAVGGNTGIGPVRGGATVAELSAHECRTLGGTVITVADDRCGASRKYCRMPDTLAACIDELTD